MKGAQQWELQQSARSGLADCLWLEPQPSPEPRNAVQGALLTMKLERASGGGNYAQNQWHDKRCDARKSRSLPRKTAVTGRMQSPWRRLSLSSWKGKMLTQGLVFGI